MGEDVLTGGNYGWAGELNSEVWRTYNKQCRHTQCLRRKHTVFALLLSPSLTPHTPFMYSENLSLFILHQFTQMRLCSQQCSLYVFCTNLKGQPLQHVLWVCASYVEPRPDCLFVCFSTDLYCWYKWSSCLFFVLTVRSMLRHCLVDPYWTSPATAAKFTQAVVLWPAQEGAYEGQMCSGIYSIVTTAAGSQI